MRNENLEKILDVNGFVNLIDESEKDVAKKIEINSSKTIKDIYIDNLENDIKSKLKEKGYSVRKVNVLAKDDENYTIESIEIAVDKKDKNEKIQIDDVILSNHETYIDNDKAIDYIASEYMLDKAIIKIVN